jgi:hypothetical protein
MVTAFNFNVLSEIHFKDKLNKQLTSNYEISVKKVESKKYIFPFISLAFYDHNFPWHNFPMLISNTAGNFT